MGSWKCLTACVVTGFFCIMSFLLSGCSADNMHTEGSDAPSDDAMGALANALTVSHSEMVKEIENNHIFIITDPKTGVQYIVYREKVGYAGMGGITPRLNADGSLYVVDLDEEAEHGEEESSE